MLTRGSVRHQYGCHRADRSAPPFHVIMHPAQYPYAEPRGEGAFSRMPPFVPLTTSGWVGMRRGITSMYDAGYLGMDPLDPQSWIRPLNIAPGMISRPLYPGGDGNQAR
jgi:hypothetical protein